MASSTTERIFEEEEVRRLVGWWQNKPEWNGSWDYFRPVAIYQGIVTMRMKYVPLPLRPLMTRDELVSELFRGPKLVQRLQAAGWLKPLPNLGTKESLFRADEAVAVLNRIIFDGERPPLLPSERPEDADKLD